MIPGAAGTGENHAKRQREGGHLQAEAIRRTLVGTMIHIAQCRNVLHSLRDEWTLLFRISLVMPDYFLTREFCPIYNAIIRFPFIVCRIQIP